MCVEESYINAKTPRPNNILSCQAVNLYEIEYRGTAETTNILVQHHPTLLRHYLQSVTKLAVDPIQRVSVHGP